MQVTMAIRVLLGTVLAALVRLESISLCWTKLQPPLVSIAPLALRRLQLLLQYHTASATQAAMAILAVAVLAISARAIRSGRSWGRRQATPASPVSRMP